MISTPIRRHDLVGNGSAGPFTYQFLIRASSDLLVYVDGNLKTLTTHYTVTGVGAETGGTVTFTTGNEPAVNAHVQLVGSEPYTQTADFQTAATLPAAALEEVLDKQTRLITQLNERTTRMPVMSLPDAYNKPAIGLSAPVAGQFVRWDALAQNLEPAVPTTIPSGLPVGGNYDHLTINGSGAVAWAQQVYNFSSNWVNLSKYASLSAAVTAIGSTTKTTLVISTSQSITGNITVTANITPCFVGAGDLNVSGGITVTIQSAAIMTDNNSRRIFTGAGSVTMTNAQYVYTDWWGPAGDDSTDDTAALQSAISSGRLVYISSPATAYKITGELTLSSNQTVIGLGRPLIHQATANNRVLVASSKNNLTIQGLRIRGGGTSGALVDTGLIDCTSCTDVRLYDNEVYEGRNGITANTCTNLWIERNHIHDFRFMGVNAAKSVNFHIDENHIHTCDQTGAVGAYGIAATGDQAGGFTQQRCTVSFNHIYDIKSWDGLMTHDVTGLHIIGNDIRDVRTAIDIGHLTATNVVKDILIAFNYCKQTTTNTWSPSSAFNAGIGVVGYGLGVDVENIVIASNIVEGFGAFAMVTGGGGIAIESVRHCAVIGNCIRDVPATAGACSGIQCTGGINNVTIEGNTITDCADQAIGFYNAIGTVVHVAGNTMWKNASATMTCAVRLQQAATNLSKVLIGDNANNVATYIDNPSGTVTWAVNQRLTGSGSWDPPSVASGAQTTTTLTVTGASLGDRVEVSFSLDLQGMTMTGYVSAANTVTVVLRNGTGGAIDLASGTVRASVWKVS